MKEKKEKVKNDVVVKKKSVKKGKNAVDVKGIEEKIDKIDDKEKIERKDAHNISINKTKKDKINSSSFNLIEVIIIMIITAVFGILIGSCASYFKGNNDIEKNGDIKVPGSFAEFLNIYNDLVSEYYFDIDKNKLIEAGIKGMVDYLGDPYSSYLNFDDSSSLNMELEGEYVGMGVTITYDADGNIYITDMFAGSPADKAGFKVGDIIVAVDGESIIGDGIVEVSNKVKGSIGGSVDIKIMRDGVEMTITLVRGKVEIPSVSYHIIEGTKIGFVKINIFARNTPEQFKTAMQELNSYGINSLVIDVRNNSGGYLSAVENIISSFLNKGDVIYQLNTKGETEKVKKQDNKLYDMPIVVLMNGASASASEILACSLRENVGAVLVGEKTFGKGTVQKAVRLESGAMIKYTIQEWYSPEGNKINLVGVMPDYKVTLKNDGNDNQLEKAVEILKKNN